MTSVRTPPSLGVTHDHHRDPPNPTPPLMRSPGNRRVRGLLALPSRPRGPAGRAGVKDPRTSPPSAFPRPQVLGRAGITGRGQPQNPPPTTTRTPLPADPGWSSAQIWGGPTPAPPPPIASGFGARHSRQVRGGRQLLSRHPCQGAPTGQKTHPVLSPWHDAAPVPQFPHPQTADASGATPRHRGFLGGGGRSEGGETNSPAAPGHQGVLSHRLFQARPRAGMEVTGTSSALGPPHPRPILGRNWAILTLAPLGPGKPITPGWPRAPCGPGGPGRPSSPGAP